MPAFHVRTPSTLPPAAPPASDKEKCVLMLPPPPLDSGSLLCDTPLQTERWASQCYFGQSQVAYAVLRRDCSTVRLSECHFVVLFVMELLRYTPAHTQYSFTVFRAALSMCQWGLSSEAKLEAGQTFLPVYSDAYLLLNQNGTVYYYSEGLVAMGDH